MSLTISYSSPLFVKSNYEGSSVEDLLKGANVTFTDEVGDEVSLDSIYLEVIDADGDIVTLTTATTPAITQTGYSYRVDEIDVSGYPAGDITLHWVGELDGYEYDINIAVAYNNTQNIIVMSGLTATTLDTTVRQDTNKELHLKLQDANGNLVDGYDVRARFRDRYENNDLVATVSATLQATASGIWAFTYNFPAATFNAGVDRFEIYWEYKLTNGDTWAEVANSRHLLSVTASSAALTTGPLAYCSEQDIRIIFPNIDKYLIPLDSNKANRDILLQNKIYEVTEMLYNNTKLKVSQHPNKRSLLKYWCAYAVAQDLVNISSDDLAGNKVTKYLNKKITNIKLSIFGHQSFKQIGNSKRHIIKDKDLLEW